MKGPIPDFLNTMAYVDLFNVLNRDFEVVKGEFFYKRIQHYWAGISGPDISPQEFIKEILEKINESHPKFFEVLSLSMQIELHSNKKKIQEIIGRNEDLEFMIEMATNNIILPTNWFHDRNKYEVMLLEKNNSNPERLQQLKKIESDKEEMNKIGMMEFYSRRPFED